MVGTREPVVLTDLGWSSWTGERKLHLGCFTQSSWVYIKRATPCSEGKQRDHVRAQEPAQLSAWLPPGPFFYPTENTTFNSSSEAERKTQRFYLSCLQVERIEELGAQPLRDLIEKVQLLGWTGGRERTRPGRGCGPLEALGTPVS